MILQEEVHWEERTVYQEDRTANLRKTFFDFCRPLASFLAMCIFSVGHFNKIFDDVSREKVWLESTKINANSTGISHANHPRPIFLRLISIA